MHTYGKVTIITLHIYDSALDSNDIFMLKKVNKFQIYEAVFTNASIIKQTS